MGLFDSAKRAIGLGGSAKRSETGKTKRRAQQLSAAISAALPSLLETYRGQLMPQALAEAGAQEAIIPRLAALQRQEALKDAELSRQLSLGDIETQRGVYGGDIAQLQQLFPEYFGLRGQVAGAASDFLANPYLTQGEEVAIERALGREAVGGGTQFTPSATETVAKAGTFGGAAREKFLQALNTALGVIPNVAPVGGMNQVNRSAAPRTQVAFPNTPDIGGFNAAVGVPFMGQVGAAQQLGIQGKLNTPSDLERGFGLFTGGTQGLANLGKTMELFF